MLFFMPFFVCFDSVEPVNDVRAATLKMSTTNISATTTTASSPQPSENVCVVNVVRYLMQRYGSHHCTAPPQPLPPSPISTSLNASSPAGIRSTVTATDAAVNMVLTRKLIHELIAAGCVKINGRTLTTADAEVPGRYDVRVQRQGLGSGQLLNASPDPYRAEATTIENSIGSKKRTRVEDDDASSSTPGAVNVERELDTVTIAQDALQMLFDNIRVWCYIKPIGVDSNMQERDRSSLLHVLRAAGLYNSSSSTPSSSTKGSTHSQHACENYDDVTATDKDRPEQPATTHTDTNTNGMATAAVSPLPPPPLRAFPIGRLDKDSCGLLLLTNSGALCERLLHPSFYHEKEYYVQIARSEADVPPTFYEMLRGGVSWPADENPQQEKKRKKNTSKQKQQQESGNIERREETQKPVPNDGNGGEDSSTAMITTLPCHVVPVVVPDGGVKGDPVLESTHGNGASGNRISNSENEKGRETDQIGNVVVRGRGAGARFRITLTQGLNRQIRRMVEAAGKSLLIQTVTTNSDKEEAAVLPFPSALPKSDTAASAVSSAVVRRAGYCVTHLFRERIGPVQVADIRSNAGESDLAGDSIIKEREIVELKGEQLLKLLRFAFGGGGSLAV